MTLHKESMKVKDQQLSLMENKENLKKLHHPYLKIQITPNIQNP